ncbi:Protein of unknown function [Pyronema omphalodes CBS 100304]|uniref:Uncharacterized protein n=1 Tax=Pyronema omphalodes (strain CBS 100304) TaxID=1076935 RepID=U4LGM4_PYROM|nr:Protein of unknown function [Pyronema omphalodes CBS 100304]
MVPHSEPLKNSPDYIQSLVNTFVNATKDIKNAEKLLDEHIPRHILSDDKLHGLDSALDGDKKKREAHTRALLRHRECRNRLQVAEFARENSFEKMLEYFRQVSRGDAHLEIRDMERMRLEILPHCNDKWKECLDFVFP